MRALNTTIFALPPSLSAKADPSLIGPDQTELGLLRQTIQEQVVDLTQQLEQARRSPGRSGEQALERDQQIHRLTARLRVLHRVSQDVCLGRMTPADGGPALYVGRFGLSGGDGRQLLVDWRSPAAEPFFAATRAERLGLVSRRRYRWSGGKVVDYWDEIFDDTADSSTVPDDQSAFLAELGTARTTRMRDVLATIARDQDAAIRGRSSGVLVVEGGPGTGKTVVALHRVAYLLYADPRLRTGHGGVLLVGPHRPYLDYVEDVLPGLGEDGVRSCTLHDLVAEAGQAVNETDPAVVALKSSARMVDVIEAAVAMYEEPPSAPVVVETPWGEVEVAADDWAAAFAAVDPGTPHNDAREVIHDALSAVVAERLGGTVDEAVGERELRHHARTDRGLTAALHRAWPLLDAADVLGDLWTVPAYLRHCAAWLSAEDRRSLGRTGPLPWTEADLPLLDAARARLGDPARAQRRARAAAARERQRAQMADVIDDLITSDDSELMVMSMLRGDDLTAALDLPEDDVPDPLAGPFAHIVVDEAQELTDAQWQMLLRRCPSGSLTVVGDRAQARRGFPESWQQRLRRVGADQVRLARLSVNYRTPSEVMAVAEPVIRVALPDANVPSSVRRSGLPVRYGEPAHRDELLAAWLHDHDDGTACVLGDPSFEPMARVRSLTPETVKGLEFDLVMLVRPEAFGNDLCAAVDRYVAMTRSTRELIVLTDDTAQAHQPSLTS